MESILFLLLIIVPIFCFYLSRYLKGSIKLSLRSRIFGKNQPLMGSLSVNSKKPLEGKLTVGLIGYKDSESSRDWKYEDVLVLEENLALKTGQEVFYDFEIPPPKLKEGLLDRAVGKIAKTIGAKVYDDSINWKVEARMDVKGVDLAKSIKVRYKV